VVAIYKGAMEDMCLCGHQNGFHHSGDDDSCFESHCECRKFRLAPEGTGDKDFDALVKLWLERL
jgi:hypothetical protein